MRSRKFESLTVGGVVRAPIPTRLSGVPRVSERSPTSASSARTIIPSVARSGFSLIIAL
jgi:hypothetical protein